MVRPIFASVNPVLDKDAASGTEADGREVVRISEALDRVSAYALLVNSIKAKSINEAAMPFLYIK